MSFTIKIDGKKRQVTSEANGIGATINVWGYTLAGDEAVTARHTFLDCKVCRDILKGYSVIANGHTYN